MPDLTTLKAVKAWLNISLESDDAILSRQISAVSGMILSYLSRPDILKKQYTEQFTGSNQTSRMLKNYPVIAVSSVAIGTVSVPASNGTSSGFYTDPPEDGPGRVQLLHLNGYSFDRCLCRIVYEAGYFIDDEPATASSTVPALAPSGAWARDEGVSYADGRVMTKVATAPSAGQYALNAKIPGQYVFSDADAGAAVLLNYSYVPHALENTCINIISERYRYRDRIGQVSKNISGEVVSFSLRDMQDFDKLTLQPYRRLTPI